MKTSIAFVLLILLVGCPSGGVPHPTVPTDTDQCPAACQKMRGLHCQEADTLPKAYCADGSNSHAGKCGDGSAAADLTCELFCQTTQNNGHAVKPSCIVAQVKKCDDIDLLCSQ